jgi:CheY-like chemotaxis protein
VLEEPSVSEISILLVGDSDRSEFREARSALGRLGRVADFPEVESAAAALSAGQVAADVIVVAQAFAGQFSQRAIDRLRRTAPLARVLGLLGSWCEGEMRTGKPWPGAIHIYWHQWPPRCDQELGRMCRGESSAWGLPPTAIEEERLLLGADSPMPKQQGLIAIYTRLLEMQDWLSAALRRRGCSTVWLRPPHSPGVEGAAAAIFDGSDCRGQQLSQLEHLAATLRPAPIIALLDFPRVEDRNRALAAGAAAVVSKPLHLDDLFWELDRLL